MDKQFKFTDAPIRALSANSTSASSTDLEVSDIEITGLADVYPLEKSECILERSYSISRRQPGLKLKKMIQYQCDQALQKQPR